MSYHSRLRYYAREITRWGVKRMFEDEGYNVELKNEDHSGTWWNPGTWDEYHWRPLTVDRYQSGPPVEHPPSASYEPRGAGEPKSLGETSDRGASNDMFVAVEDSAVWKIKSDELSWIKDSILKFGHGRPKALNSLWHEVAKARPQLMGESEWNILTDNQGVHRREIPDAAVESYSDVLLGNALIEMENWNGHTASVFKTTVGNGDRWKEAIQNCYCIAESLRCAVEGQLAVIVSVRHDIITVCDQTLSKLKAHGNSADQPDWEVALAITGCVLTTALSLASAGTASVLAGAAFTITGTIIAAADDDQPQAGKAKSTKYNIGGDTAGTILSSMYNAVGHIEDSMTSEEKKIVDKLTAWQDSTEDKALRKVFEVSVIQPEVTKISRANIGSRDMSADVNELEQGAHSLAVAANRVLTACQIVSEAGDNAGAIFASEVSGEPTAVCQPWLDLKSTLSELTHSNGSLVKKAGEVISSYALESSVVDADTKDQIRSEYHDLEKIHA